MSEETLARLAEVGNPSRRPGKYRRPLRQNARCSIDRTRGDADSPVLGARQRRAGADESYYLGAARPRPTGICATAVPAPRKALGGHPWPPVATQRVAPPAGVQVGRTAD